MPRHIAFALVLGVIAALAGCARVEAAPSKVEPLAGSTWSGLTAEGSAMTIEFVADGSMNVAYDKTKFNRASWKQEGNKVYWEMNGCYCEFNGKIVGDTLNGDSHNVTGKKWQTNMTRIGRVR